MKQAEHVQWIGERPSGLQISVVFFVGVIGILLPGLQPIVLAALNAAGGISLAQMGHAATAELLAMGLAAALAGAVLPTKRLISIGISSSLLMAVGNWLTPLAAGETVTALRTLTGAMGGILIWITSALIARCATPDRWAAIYLAVQTFAQFIVGLAMTKWIEPHWGAPGDFALLAWISVASAAAALLLPAAFAALPRTEGGISGLPPLKGIAALVVVFLVMMFIVSIWVYYDPIAHEAGLSSEVSNNAVLLSLAFQVAGGSAAAILAGRLPWFPTLMACAAVDLAMVWLLGTHPSELLFYIDAAIFGFLWLFILPFEVPMLIEADPSRRAAVLNSGIGLLGGSIGPSVVAEIISPDNTRGALWLAAACLIVSLAIAAALHAVLRPKRA